MRQRMHLGNWGSIGCDFGRARAGNASAGSRDADGRCAGLNRTLPAPPIARHLHAGTCDLLHGRKKESPHALRWLNCPQSNEATTNTPENLRSFLPPKHLASQLG